MIMKKIALFIGMFLLAACSSTQFVDSWKNKEITLVGPASSVTADNKQLLMGSINYYFALLFAIPGKFDPIVSSYLYMLFSSLGIIPLYLGMRKLADQKAALLMVVIYTLLPMFIDFTRFFFVPLIVLSTILIYLMGLYKTKPNNIHLFSVFVYIGILMQIHYQIAVVLFILFIYYFIKNRFKIKSILIMIGGFCLGFSPMILFELWQKVPAHHWLHGIHPLVIRRMRTFSARPLMASRR